MQGIIWDTWVYCMFARIGISDLFISSTNSAFHRTTVERDNAPEHELQQALQHSSKLVNPFYCIREGHFIRA